MMMTFRLFLVVAFALAVVGFAPTVMAADEGTHDDPPAADTHGDPAHAGGGHGSGPVSTHPLSIDPDLALFTGVLFVVLMAVLWKFAWGPIAAGLDSREKGIQGQIDEAHRTNDEAKEMLADYEKRLGTAEDEVREMLEKARRDADTQKQQIVAEAQDAAKAQTDRSLREIEAAKQYALREMAAKSIDVAVELAGKVVSREIKKDDHTQLITEALSRFPSDN